MKNFPIQISFFSIFEKNKYLKMRKLLLFGLLTSNVIFAQDTIKLSVKQDAFVHSATPDLILQIMVKMSSYQQIIGHFQEHLEIYTL